MTYYEYERERIEMTEDELEAFQMQILPTKIMEGLDARVDDLLSKRGANGWRVMQPIGLPVLWFERTSTKKPKKD
jgi:hypothetical protein